MPQRQPALGFRPGPVPSALSLVALVAPLLFTGCSGGSDEAAPADSGPGGPTSAGAPTSGAGTAAQGRRGGPGGRGAQAGSGPRSGQVPPLREYPPIEESPGYEDYENARVARDLRQWTDATRSIKVAIEKDPERSDLHALLGEILVRQGNIPGAQRAYQDGLELDPGNGELWHNLGLVNVQLGGHEYAEKCLINAVLAMPDAPRSHYQLGLARYRLASVVVGAESLDRERMQSAVASFMRAIELKPKLTDAHLWAGIGLKRLGEYEAAAKYFENVLKLEPGHVDAHIHLAECAQQTSDPALCEHYYTEALALDPNSARAHVGIARLREFDGNYEAARASYEAAVAADPQFSDAYYGLSQACLRLGLEEEAEAAKSQFEKLAQRDQRKKVAEKQEVLSRQHEILYETGISYQMAGEPARAEESFRAVLELAPEHSKALMQLGVILRDRGQLEEALDHFKRAWDADAGNARARRLSIETAELMQGSDGGSSAAQDGGAGS